MRVHHLSCGSQCPFPARLLDDGGSLFSPGLIVAHCLLVETSAGLILVDTGIGLVDMRPRHTLGRPFEAVMRPRLHPEETAIRQVERLGFRADDVRDIVLTHLDLDHAGGLPDFPQARVHILDLEYEAAMERKGLDQRLRYVQAHWAHHPDWVIHSAEGDTWMGFESVAAVDGDRGPEVLIVPLAGHTRGHSGVAVRSGDGWLMHCGDAYFHRGEMDVDAPHCPPGLRAFQQLAGTDRGARKANQRRLRELNRDHGDQVTLFCSHDPVELEILQGVS